MAKFMVNASYTAEGAKGLLKDGGTGRRAAVELSLKEMGGRLETMYFAFGKNDVVAIVELPDSIAATALALAINASGAVRIQTTPLISPEDVDQAVRKAVKYRAPGVAREPRS
jgi:uncharacterized protein with GYD domain